MTAKKKWLQLAILIAFIALLPIFFPSGYYYRVGALIFVNALAVVGLVILIGYAGQISLGHAGFAGIGAYACALAPPHLGLHPAFAVLLGALVSAVMAVLIGRPILRLKGYYLAVATLAALLAMGAAGWWDGAIVCLLAAAAGLEMTGQDFSPAPYLPDQRSSDRPSICSGVT